MHWLHTLREHDPTQLPHPLVRFSVVTGCQTFKASETITTYFTLVVALTSLPSFNVSVCSLPFCTLDLKIACFGYCITSYYRFEHKFA